MKKMWKKALAMLLVVIMIGGAAPYSILSLHASAGSYSGTYGANIHWQLDTDTGVLSITGTGAMKDSVYFTDAPWSEFRSSIKSAVIAKGVTSIGNFDFSHCYALTSITIPNSVTSIGNGAFYACSRLTSITIPNSVTSIGNGIFCECSSLTSVTIPSSLTSIGESAFGKCDSLTAFTVDTNNPSFSNDDSGVLYNKNKTILLRYPIGNPRISFTIPDSVTNIGDDAFYDCSSLKSVTIPNSVKSIGDAAFGYCTSLVIVTIPDSVTHIGDYAFCGCTGLTSVTIPDSVTSIDKGTFIECYNLTHVTIPDSVTHIGDYAFRGCTGLTSVTIPNSVTSIGNTAFHDCISLTDVYYTGSKEEWNAISIGSGNEPLTDGDKIHYNSDGDTSTPSTLSTRDVTELWKPDVLFSRDSTVYDPELAYVAGWLCDQSEAETDGDSAKGELKMRSALVSLGFTNIGMGYNQPELCFSIASSANGHFLAIVFRGSKECKEGIEDFRCGANSEMWGFHAYDYPYDFYIKVRDALNTYVETHPNLKTGLQKVLITGHSLGGAGANLLAFDMIKHATLKQGNTWYKGVLSPENIYCYTFGALDSINDLYEDGSEEPTLPVKAGYENIHNIYNWYDTFGKFGVCSLYANHINEIIKKIGQMHFFTDDRKQDKRTWWLGALPVPENTTNHDMPTYLDAVYNGIVDKVPLTSNQLSLLKDTSNRKVGVAECPVDVEIYENGVLVGRTNRNTVDTTVTTIPLAVIDDVKYFPMENDREYRVVFRAFDEGEMNFTVYEKGLTHPNDAAVFREVALTEGKMMVSEIGKADSVEDVKLYVTNEAGEKSAEILSDGSEREIVSLHVSAPAAATYKKSFTVSADIRNLPADTRVEWTADNAKVQLTPAADGKTCTVKSAFKGTITLTSIVYGADGETLAQESATVTVKYAWWQWLIRIFLLGFLWY